MTREALHAVTWLAERYDLGDQIDKLTISQLPDLVTCLDGAILQAVEKFAGGARPAVDRQAKQFLALIKKVKAGSGLNNTEREQAGELIGLLTDAMSETL